MTILILGLIVFLGVHTLTTLRERRTALIEGMGPGPYKGVYSLVALLGLVLIFYGFGAYRASGYIPVWNPPTWTRHLALLLMWPAFVALAATYAPTGKIKSMLKHPMLVAVKIWALAHLLANGDLGSMILFGALLAWAVYDRIAVKKRGDMGPRPTGFGSGDIVALVAGTVGYGLMLWLHPVLIGVSVIGR